jgi:hypothetical protein
MKRRLTILLALPLAAIGGRLLAGQLVVFGEKDFYVLDASPSPAGPSWRGRRPLSAPSTSSTRRNGEKP